MDFNFKKEQYFGTSKNGIEDKQIGRGEVINCIQS